MHVQAASLKGAMLCVRRNSCRAPLHYRSDARMLPGVVNALGGGRPEKQQRAAHVCQPNALPGSAGNSGFASFRQTPGEGGATPGHGGTAAPDTFKSTPEEVGGTPDNAAMPPEAVATSGQAHKTTAGPQPPALARISRLEPTRAVPAQSPFIDASPFIKMLGFLYLVLGVILVQFVIEAFREEWQQRQQRQQRQQAQVQHKQQ